MNRPTELRQVSNDKKFRVDLILHIHFLKINKGKVETYLARPYTRHKMRPLPALHHFQQFLPKRYGPTDLGTNGRTDQRTDTPSYRDARTHPKSLMLNGLTFSIHDE